MAEDKKTELTPICREFMQWTIDNYRTSTNEGQTIQHALEEIEVQRGKGDDGSWHPNDLDNAENDLEELGSIHGTDAPLKQFLEG